MTENQLRAYRGSDGRRGRQNLLADLAAQQGRDPIEVLRDVLAGTRTNREAAQVLGVSDRTVARWIRRYGVEVVWI